MAIWFPCLRILVWNLCRNLKDWSLFSPILSRSSLRVSPLALMMSLWLVCSSQRIFAAEGSVPFAGVSVFCLWINARRRRIRRTKSHLTLLRTTWVSTRLPLVRTGSSLRPFAPSAMFRVRSLKNGSLALPSLLRLGTCVSWVPSRTPLLRTPYLI